MPATARRPTSRPSIRAASHPNIATGRQKHGQTAAVGARRAKEIILTGTPFSAEQALAWGLVNKICENEELLPEALATAQRIADNAPISTRQAKKSISVATEVDLKSGYAFEIEAYNRLVGTEDRLEGIRAFNEKRRPEFKGR